MPRQRLTLAVVCAATAMLMLDIAVVNTAVPSIARSLGSGLQGIQWLVDAYTVALAATVLTAGSVADRLGRRRCFAVGVVVFTAMSACCGAATSIVALDLFRAGQGLGAAVMFATSFALIADAFPDPGQRGGAIAAYGATIGASFAIGPLAGGALTTWWGWRSVFLINIPIGLLALAATPRIADGRELRARRLDWTGQTLLMGGLVLLVVALLRGNDAGWSSASIVGELVAAAVLIAAFVLTQLRQAEPMLPPALFRNPSFTGAQVAAFAMSATFFAQFVYASLYLQNIVGLSPIRTGLAFLPATVIMFIASALTVQLQARVSARLLISVGLAGVSVGLLLMLLAGVHSSWWAIVPGEVLAGVGTGLFNPALSTVVLREFTDGQAGLAAGVNDTARQTGIAVGVAALGALVPASAALGQANHAAFVRGFHHATLLAAVGSALGAVAAGYLIDRRRAPSAATGGRTAGTRTPVTATST